MQLGKTKLLAKVLEYEHALEHIATDHSIDGMSQGPDYPHCEDCESLAQSALDGVNREDFTDCAKAHRWYYKPYHWYWDIRFWIADKRDSRNK